MKSRPVLTLLLLVQVSTSGWAQDGAALAAAAERSVSSYPRYTVFDNVSVRLEAGTVVLTGKVTQALKREEIGKRVAGLDGVSAVRNEIEVLPASIGDDQLRRRVARAIYGSPTFWRFAAMPDPPIHIIVEHGRVTLTGIVPSHVERAVAQSLATGHGELAVRNELRTDYETRAKAAERRMQ